MTPGVLNLGSVRVASLPFLSFYPWSNSTTNVSLCLSRHSVMKMYGGVEVTLHAFLTATSNGSKWPASCLGLYTPGEGARGTRCVGGWVVSRSGLNALLKRKISAPTRNRTPTRRLNITMPELDRLPAWCTGLLHSLNSVPNLVICF
jgi:hypothetical protein